MEAEIACRSNASIRRHCERKNHRIERVRLHFFFSPISASTLCVKSTAGHGSRSREVHGGKQEIADDGIEATCLEQRTETPAVGSDRYLPTAYGSGSSECANTSV